jgi:aspartate racemase
MNLNKSKKIGIFGISPYATIDLYKNITDLTPAKKDWEYCQIIINSNPRIPSRTRHVILGEEDPTPYMIKGVQDLERNGVDLIALPCNSAHYYYDALQSSVKVEIVNLIEAVTKYILLQQPSIKKIGLLSAPIPAKKKLYYNSFKKHGIEVLHLDEENQDLIYEVIDEVKKGILSEQGNREKVKTAIGFIKKLGAEAVILGCTELPMAIKQDDVDLPIYDCNQIYAQKIVSKALE